jgi:hypothetical protein
MHICADEIIAVTTVIGSLTGAVRFRTALRAFLARLPLIGRLFEPQAFVLPRTAHPSKECRDCDGRGVVPKFNAFSDWSCDSCEGGGKELIDDEKVLRQWLENVAPLLTRGDLSKAMLRDGSGYLVNGFVYPIHPVEWGADWYRDEQGLRLATADESKAMRGGAR